MKNELKKITQVLFGEEELSSSMYSDTDRVDTLTQKFNSALDLNKDAREAFRSTHISKTVISPLAFYGVKNKPKFDFVYMRLTPGFHDIRIRMEKQSAGDDWKSYYDFYTSNKILDFLKEDNSSFNRNLNKLFFALYEEHELGKITLEDIGAKVTTEKTEVFNKLIEEKSVIFPYIVPFHSYGFDINLNGINHLRETIPTYDKYLNELFEYIKTNTEDNGIIVTNGFADSRVVHGLLDSYGATLLLENKLFSFLKWDTKYAILFNDQIITRHGLRSDYEVDKVLSIIRHILNGADINTSVQELKEYCNALLDNRSEEDFKDRGKRIKGVKSKGIKVKSFGKK